MQSVRAVYHCDRAIACVFSVGRVDLIGQSNAGRKHFSCDHLDDGGRMTP